MPPQVIYKVQPPAPPPRLALRPVPQKQPQLIKPIALRPAATAVQTVAAPQQRAIMMQQPTQKALILRPVQNQGGGAVVGGGQPILLQNGQQPMYVGRGVFNKPIVANAGGSRYGTLKSM